MEIVTMEILKMFL